MNKLIPELERMIEDNEKWRGNVVIETYKLQLGNSDNKWDRELPKPFTEVHVKYYPTFALLRHNEDDDHVINDSNLAPNRKLEGKVIVVQKSDVSIQDWVREELEKLYSS
jgi:hypothetical protein